MNITLIPDFDGSVGVKGFVCLITNITDQKNYENVRNKLGIKDFESVLEEYPLLNEIKVYSHGIKEKTLIDYINLIDKTNGVGA